MARTELQRSEILSPETLRAGSRLRLRAHGLLAGAMDAAEITKSELAKRLGIRKSAVSDALNGNGNFRLQTLAEYLAVMGFELELVPVRSGEVLLSMRERRAPEVEPLTMRDRDWDSRSLTINARSTAAVGTNSVASARSRAIAAPSAWGTVESRSSNGSTSLRKVKGH